MDISTGDRLAGDRSSCRKDIVRFDSNRRWHSRGRSQTTVYLRDAPGDNLRRAGILSHLRDETDADQKRNGIIRRGRQGRDRLLGSPHGSNLYPQRAGQIPHGDGPGAGLRKRYIRQHDQNRSRDLAKHGIANGSCGKTAVEQDAEYRGSSNL